jgi:hypothetical protein
MSRIPVRGRPKRSVAHPKRLVPGQTPLLGRFAGVAPARQCPHCLARKRAGGSAQWLDHALAACALFMTAPRLERRPDGPRHGRGPHSAGLGRSEVPLPKTR